MTTPTPPPPIHWGQTTALGALLLLEAVLSAALLAAIFPTTTVDKILVFDPGFAWLASPTWWTIDRGLISLALLAGAMGSSIHTMQSFAAFVGDRKLESSWIWWYVLRAPIGAILGLFFYVALRGGVLTIGSDNASATINPYGVVAICGLAGWFSKRATDKLAEVFDIIFRTTKETEFTGKLGPEVDKPSIERIEPMTLVAAEGGPLTIIGKGFKRDAHVQIDETKLDTTQDDAGNLTVTLAPDAFKPGTHVLLVINPTTPVATQSEPFELTLT